ncbi:MAG: transcription-repair coupling factor, partial [Bacteroidetes bacterium]|nr:transcription-repair coupling factor [Bacteroidota bacterium]
MGTKDLLQLYESDGVIQTLASQVKKEQPYTLHIKGLAGSLDAIVASTLFKSNSINHLFVMHDKEEVGYFKNDVQNLLDTEVRIFPSSYKKPYQFEEIENANVLQRAEILSEINQQNTQGALIIT